MLGPCVRPSVCQPQVGIVPKRLNVGSRKTPYNNPGTLSFTVVKDLSELRIIIYIAPMSYKESRRVGRWSRLKSAILDQYLATSQKRDIVTAALRAAQAAGI